MDSKLYKDDINKVALSNPRLEQAFKGQSVLVTGATGIIGAPIVDLLLHLGASVTVAGRNKSSTKNFWGNRISFAEYDAEQPITLKGEFNYLFHAAAITGPEAYVNKPVEVINSNAIAASKILEWARYHSDHSLYVSSSEVYGIKNNSTPWLEDDVGTINFNNVRSCYAQSKRLTENLCVAYSAEYKQSIKIVRPGHIYGPHARRTSSLMAATFLFDALEGKDLVMKSTGEQVRSYTYSLDTASAILTVLAFGGKGEAYNIANPESTATVRQFAQELADAAGVKLTFNLGDATYKKAINPMNTCALCADKLVSLGWKPCFSLTEGVSHTFQIARDFGL